MNIKTSWKSNFRSQQQTVGYKARIYKSKFIIYEKLYTLTDKYIFLWVNKLLCSIMMFRKAFYKQTVFKVPKNGHMGVITAVT